MNKYQLIENGKILHRSGSLEKLINYTVKTKNAIIIYNDNIIWEQRPRR